MPLDEIDKIIEEDDEPHQNQVQNQPHISGIQISGRGALANNGLGIVFNDGAGDQMSE